MTTRLPPEVLAIALPRGMEWGRLAGEPAVYKHSTLIAVVNYHYTRSFVLTPATADTVFLMPDASLVEISQALANYLWLTHE